MDSATRQAPEKSTSPQHARVTGWRAAQRADVAGVAWFLAVVSLAAASVWVISGTSYWLDLFANLGAQVLIVCCVVAMLVAAVRRWRALAVAVLACAVQLVPLVRHRAAFLPAAPSATAAPGAVRFLHYNDSSMSDKGTVYQLIEQSGADVISILSPPVQQQVDAAYGTGPLRGYPGRLVRAWKPAADGVNTDVSPGFVVSRWPITRIDCSFLGPMGDRFMCGVVQRPESAFAIVAVHPRSPRNQARWREGNLVIEALVALAAKLRADGLPIVVLADLNATPTGWRSREACGAGDLRRAKPLFQLDGTYPDVVPLNIRTGRTSSIGAAWPLSIAIDDALISDDVTVQAWGTLNRLKSEHCPVIIDLRIPATHPSAANPSGR